MKADPLIVGVGEILWDMLPKGKQLGGAPANFAYHARQLGADAVPVSCVGEDALGREILDRIDALRMSRQFISVDPAHPTGTVDVSVDPRGVPTFTIREGVAWDFIPSHPLLLDLARGADAVCFGSLAQRGETSRATIQQLLAATSAECLRVFDINLRQHYFTREVIEESLRLSRVLKLNDQELPVLQKLLDLPAGEPPAFRELTRRYNLRAIALTRGDAGSRLYIHGETFDHGGFPAKVVDTVGAGDAFTAALTIGLLRGDDPARINESANRLASFVCSQAGATPPIPRL